MFNDNFSSIWIPGAKISSKLILLYLLLLFKLFWSEAKEEIACLKSRPRETLK